MIRSIFLERILTAGISPDTDVSLKKKIRMTNEMSLFFSISALIYVFVFISMDAPMAGYCLIGFMVLFASVTYFNWLNHFRAARLILILSIYSGIGFFSALLGSSSLVDIIFVSILAVPFAISDRSDSYINWISLVLSIGLFSVSNFTTWLHPYAIDGVLPAIQYPVAAFVFAMPFIVMNQCRKQQNLYEDRLKVRTEEINIINSQLMSANNRLERMVDSLQESMKEREILLKEVHHRVKNNMQIISSLLNLQSGYLNDPWIKTVFHCSQLRISSMAMVHEMLYKSGDLSRIEISEYVENLIPKLVCAFRGLHHKINIDLDVPKINLSIDTAVPVGLIINEIVTNSLKHGFEGKETGTIYLSIRPSGNGGYTMNIGDDGKGAGKGALKNGRAKKESSSLGLMLINDLVAQLDGKISNNTTSRNGGMCYTIFFREAQRKGIVEAVTQTS